MHVSNRLKILVNGVVAVGLVSERIQIVGDVFSRQLVGFTSVARGASRTEVEFKC